jgi:hypothetical protein
VRRVDRQRREHREDHVVEDLIDVLAFLVGELGDRQQGDAMTCRLGQDRVAHHRLLAHHELGHLGGDLVELLGGGHPIGGPGDHARGLLVLQRGHTDLVELVEVRRDDGAELQAL